MKHRLTWKLAAILTLTASAAYAGNVGIDLNVHLGNQPRTVIVPAPVPPTPSPYVNIDEDVNFVLPSALGFYVAVGVPYDLFYANNTYFLYRDGRWLRAAASRGPWVVTGYRDLPPLLRRHRIDRIRAYRNAEYDIYRRDRDHYRGRHFMAARDEWKEQRRDEREHRKEERRDMREDRRGDRRDAREERRHDQGERRGRD